MVWATGHNGGDSPVVISDDGRTLGGGDWATFQTTDDAAKAAIANGSLVVIDDEPRDGQAPAAHAALEQTALFNERAEAVGTHDKASLLKLAVKAGLVEDGAEISRAELDARVVRSDMNVPKKAAPKSATQTSDNGGK